MKTLIAFGVGMNFYPLVERLDKVCEISAFCDNNSEKWGQHLLGDHRICIAPQQLSELQNPFVLIMAERESSIIAIEEQCDGYNIPHQRVYDFIEELGLQSVECHWPQLIQRQRIHKFIELLVHGTTACNFHCEYCYVWLKNEFTYERETSEYTAKEIRETLSQKKLGGPCHINACALGETLLSKDIVELTYELLEEGHYLSIITNGTITQKIDEILQFPKDLLERMFFKLSFHYAELKRTNLLESFWENVDKIKKSPCSFSLEITPCDTLIKDIDIVKEEFNRRAAGAMPHITFTRDTNKEDLDLLSDLTLEEYRDTWKTFQSDLFDLKCDLYKRHICEFCYAGSWSYRVNVVNGNLQSCYQQKLSGTIFDRDQKTFPLLTVGHDCCLDYCFNNHAFLAWGDVPEIVCSTYFDVRDRVGTDEVHWIKEPYAAVMKQKLYDNNFAYMGRWSDYKKLFAVDRKPAFILFNSPDYSNLGDHAIALAERRLFRKLFPEREFIEVSCEQYIKENVLIQNVIQKEDVLLINGGGYLGSLWLWLEDVTKNIVQQYPQNQILIFPQTIYFEDSRLGEAERKSLADTFNAHDNLTLMLRDLASYELAGKLLADTVRLMLIPDIALSLKWKPSAERRGSLVCIREDKEAAGISFIHAKRILAERNLLPEMLSTLSEENTYLDGREEQLANLIHKISSAEVIVTDRLHAMLLCAVTGTPCVAFDNVSGKVSAAYRWLQENGGIVLCTQESCLEECLDKVLNVESKDRNWAKNIDKKFEELKKFLKENCFV